MALGLLRMAQDATSVNPRCRQDNFGAAPALLQDTLGSPRMTQYGTWMHPGLPGMSPGCTQDGPRTAQDGLGYTQDCPGCTQDDPRMHPGLLRMAKDCTRMAPG
jgi:hypothetical protein